MRVSAISRWGFVASAVEIPLLPDFFRCARTGEGEGGSITLLSASLHGVKIKAGLQKKAQGEKINSPTAPSALEMCIAT